jgi:hypothetical protein
MQLIVKIGGFAELQSIKWEIFQGYFVLKKETRLYKLCRSLKAPRLKGTRPFMVTPSIGSIPAKSNRNPSCRGSDTNN